MTAPLQEGPDGSVDEQDVSGLLQGKTVLALGPGLGTAPHTVRFVRRLVAECPLPIVLDADGLNAIAGWEWPGASGPRILTPHPGEMSRLLGHPVDDRLNETAEFARHLGVTVLLKGQRSVVASPAGECWVNPTGTPAMGTAGSGDILTGMIAALIAQHPARIQEAVLAAVWLHGKSGELAAEASGEMPVIATDLPRYLPGALRAANG
jgi:NAD(P)H-hydrate epimerase